MADITVPAPRRTIRVLITTNSNDRGSTSRTLEAWAGRLSYHDVTPLVSVGREGPLLDALRSQGIQTFVESIRVWPAFKWPVPFLRTALRLAWIIRRHNVDLVHVNEHDHHRAPALAARLAGVPIVTHLRFRPEASYARWLFRPPYVPARLFFTSRTQLADTSQALQGVIPPERCRIIYNGLSLAEFTQDKGARERLRRAWGLDEGTIALGIACAISTRKRVDHFIRLVARLRDGGFRVHGYVAGQAHFVEDETLLAELRELVSSLDLQEHLTFLGYIEPSAPLFRAWDISVSTSAYETFGMSVLEAMACGCATVCYPGGSVAEVGGDAVHIVPDGNEAALLSACRELCRNDAVRRAAAAAGRARARHFDIGESVALLAGEYRDVIRQVCVAATMQP